MEQQVKVAISADFMTAFARLPRQVQGHVTEFINKFRNDPRSPGIHYEKINACQDQKICSVRIDNTYRGIVVRQEESGVYLLLWVDHHDEAYEWARRKRCEVNRRTGAIQIFEVQMTQAVQQSNHTAPVQNAEPIFAGASDEQLLKLSVPEEQLAYVRSFTDRTAFYAAKDNFNAETYENLSWLAEGFPIEEVLEMLEDQENGTGTSLADALNSPETLQSFVVVEGEEELRRIMAEPLERWRVFLHPTQRKIITKNYNGPARVLGGAGTGKTVVAMHRAKLLAAGLKGRQKVLFTTYTANLASDIRDNLRKICNLDEMRRIEVINLDAWVSHFLRESGYSAEIAYGDKIDDLWSEAILSSGTALDVPDSFYQEEWNRVAIAQEAMTLEKYLKASRSGRGTQLNRKKRIEVFKVFESYQNLMKEYQLRDINTAMYEASVILKDSPVRNTYEHVIVDEAQDLSDNALRLLRAIAGDEHPNDIFIVGDSHQRIYKNRPVLSRSGINVRGRSRVLKINYRTTEEIRRYAFALLQGISFDDLDEDYDPGDKCQSLTHGAKPDIREFATIDEEFDFIHSQIQTLQDAGTDLNSICVVARKRDLIKDYVSRFAAVGIKAIEIKHDKSDDRSLNGIRVATMHRVKGLEFQYIFAAAVNYHVVPLDAAIDHTDAVSEAETMTAEKCLLYVALTRAQKGAYITSYGRKSDLI